MKEIRMINQVLHDLVDTRINTVNSIFRLASNYTSYITFARITGGK